MFERWNGRWACKGISERIWDLVDGSLTDEDKQRVLDHTARCRSCSEELRFAERAGRTARESGALAPEPRRGWEEIRAELAAPAISPGRRHPELRLVMSAAAACALVILLWPRGEKEPATVSGPAPVVQGPPQVDIASGPTTPVDPPYVRPGRGTGGTSATRSGGGSILVQMEERRRKNLSTKESHGQLDKPIELPQRETIVVSRSPELLTAPAQPAVYVTEVSSDPVTADGHVLVSGSAPEPETFGDPVVSVEASFSSEATP